MRDRLSPDQVRLREELAAAREQIVALLRSAVGEGLAPEQAQEMVEEVRAWSGPNAFRLLRFLSGRPDALRAPGSDCPLPATRLLLLLAAAGFGDRVAPAACADCGRTDPVPSRSGPEGRVCERCAARRGTKPCARCGTMARINSRREEGGICKPCRDKEPGARKECGICHRMMVPDRHLPDGTYLCQTCAPRKLRACCRCGRERRIAALTADGPLCGGCYSSPPRLCGVCGKVSPIHTRATGTSPDTCYTCAKGHEETCSRCGKVGRGQRIDYGRGAFSCDPCAPGEVRKREPRPCTLCARTRAVGIFWPMGPVCGPCYAKARSMPALCASCGRQRILIGRTASGDLQCRTCALPDGPPHRCTGCGESADLLPGRRCPRCTLTARVSDLLSGDAVTIPGSLEPLARVLTGAANPYPVLAWLRRSPAAQLLGRLAREAGPLDHEALDALPQRHATAYVRGLLVTAMILPPRDENLALLTNWAARTLAGLPPHHAMLISPFAEWHIIRDARRRSARGRYSYAAHKGDCTNIRAAINFLTWLDTQRLTLADLGQSDLDTWAAGNPTLRARSIPFIRWATARRLTTTGLTIEHPPSQFPGHFQVEEVHQAELRRCLGDASLPLDVRVAGALVRLYALTLTRIVELTADQIRHDEGHTYLTVSRHPVVLPPKLARLIEEQLQHNASRPSGVDGTRYLLPGHSPGRTRNPASLSERLKRYGLPARAARNTAMMEALADLPPMVISDLFGIDPKTAERWAAFAGGRWSDYLATHRI
ncbi:XRE family transcriptional regulator [Streptomyces sp. NBC_01288]|uniref:XRE family transcriptional regulator n=1 Tax=Streptomyces sp. NBC_01288 TaxID=2903814 RepID=UPI002E14917E|nr:XRE family transcriptional regulator [Streptomyces sp. NBC_01288]